MPDDYDDLVQKISFVKDAVDFVNIDVMDGRFVPSVSWPYVDGAHFDAMIAQDEGLPHWEDLDFSVDLMVANPQQEAPKWIELGVSEVALHVETLGGDVDFVRTLKEDGIVRVCLSLSPSTPNEELDQYAGFFDCVQFMGIEKIGYQGEPFVEEVLDKIADFKEKYPEVPIMIDGGVSVETIKSLADAGVTRFAVGSAIFKAFDAKEAIEELREAAK